MSKITGVQNPEYNEPEIQNSPETLIVRAADNAIAPNKPAEVVGSGYVALISNIPLSCTTYDEDFSPGTDISVISATE
ncbi:MAG: hypothetical protein NC218_02400 [Acetobacter sp.]|nr:hypothetical protein [Acetobacter sp.]